LCDIHQINTLISLIQSIDLLTDHSKENMEDLGDLSSFFDNIEYKPYSPSPSLSSSASSTSSISSSSGLGLLIRDFDRNIISSDTLLYSTENNNNLQIKSEEVKTSIYDTEMFPVELDNLSFYTDDEDSSIEENNDNTESSSIKSEPASPINLNTCGAITKTYIVPVIHVTAATPEDENITADDHDVRDQRSTSVASFISNTDEENDIYDSEESDERSPSVVSSRHSIIKDDDKDYIAEEMDEDEDDHSDEDYVIRRRHGSSSSNLDSDTDGEWNPDEKPRIVQRKRIRGRRNSRTSNRGVTKSKSHTPTPQRRAPGTTLKITQWIVSLLRDPEYNPSVITWHDEKRGIFMIKDTDKYASLWGQVKQNKNMTYEKLSRAMRYSYKNNELKTVREQRLTYKFGPNMVNFRAKDPSDPNFEKIRSKSRK